MKGFLEEYGLIIIVVAVIMVMLLLGTTVGADAKENIIETVKNFLDVAEQVTPELENTGGEKNVNEYGFYFNETYSIYVSAPDIIPMGENSFVFNKDGTVYHYVDDEYIQTLIYTADEMGNVSVPAFGATFCGGGNGHYIYIPEYNKIFIQGPGVIIDGDYIYRFYSNDVTTNWVVEYIGSDTIDYSKIKTEIHGFPVSN